MLQVFEEFFQTNVVRKFKEGVTDAVHDVEDAVKDVVAGPSGSHQE